MSNLKELSKRTPKLLTVPEREVARGPRVSANWPHEVWLSNSTITEELLATNAACSCSLAAYAIERRLTF